MKIFLKSMKVVIILCIILNYVQVKMPSFISNSMVLQQKFETLIWGRAKSGTHISITPSWGNINYQTLADNKTVILLQLLKNDFYIEDYFLRLKDV